MKIRLQIKAKYSETYLYYEPDVYPFENIITSIHNIGVHIPFEKLEFDGSAIYLHKHKTFNYILAFEKPYNRNRFE